MDVVGLKSFQTARMDKGEVEVDLSRFGVSL